MKSQIKSRGRPIEYDDYLIILEGLGIFTIREAEKQGVPHETLRRLINKQKVRSLGYGCYCHLDLDLDPEVEDYAVACKKFGPDAAIGGPTALVYHGLTNQVPSQISVLVRRGKRTRIKLFRLMGTELNLKIGVEDRGYYRVTSLDRTIVDAFYFSRTFGLETAFMAARRSIKDGLTTPNEILKQARDLGVERIILRHWAALVAEDF